MATPNRTFLAVCLTAALTLTLSTSRAAVLPEFAPAIEFDSAGPQPTVAKLKGKAVIVLFFQSSDKAGNAWSGKLIGEMQESFGTNKTVVLMAIKTDGGGVNAAKNYLSSKGAKLDQWVVGNDAGAKYSGDLVGDPLWYYLIVGANGNIVERGKAGITYNVVVGPNKKTEQHYSLANHSIIKSCGKLTTVLPADKAYPSSVAPLARLAELGDAAKALAICTTLLPKPKEKQAATELLADLQPVVDKQISDRLTLLDNAKAASAARYDAYNELALMLKDLKAHPAGAKIGPALAKARQDPALQKEARADSAYKGLAARLQKAGAREKPRMAKDFEALAKQFEGTKYGELAGGIALDLAASAETK